ncbi:MAG: DNA internalization-related competence protein ComEC/Rec2 [Bacilli bacterium]|nr:DNA internalization-related competence protein ComEC/Rec2 [Bacilli bacterium]
MQKLKIILRSNIFYVGLLFFTVVYSVCVLLNAEPLSKYKTSETILKGKIISYTIKGEKNTFVIKGKEKVIAYFYSKNIGDEKKLKTYQIGDFVSLKGSFSKIDTSSNFYLFQYKKYLYSKKIYRSFTISSYKKITEASFLYKMKNRVYTFLSTYQSSAYMYAFILGDTNFLEEDAKESFRKNGISHLLAISGMHVTLLSVYLLKIGRRIFSNEKQSYILCLFLLFFYLFITGFPISMVRAVLFFFIAAFDKFLYLGISKIKIWILTLCFFLLQNPYSIYQIGFLFTFAVTFFLILSNFRWQSYKSYFKKTLYTSNISFLASIPILVNTFSDVPLLTPLYNLFFIPFVTFCIFPISLFCLIFPYGDTFFYIISTFFEKISLFCSTFSYTISLPHLPFLLICFYYISLFYFIKKSRIRYKLIPFLLLILFCFFWQFRFYSTITMLDIGQGDSFLIEQKDGKNILIDTGGKVFYQKEKREAEQGNLARYTIIPYMKARGIHQIDALILTHGDYDHVGESLYLVKHFPVKQVFFNSGQDNGFEKEIMRTLKSKKITYEKISRKNIYIGKQKWQFLNQKNTKNENLDSLIAYTKIGKHNILFMGDAGEENEKKLLDVYKLPKMDILKVGHHGSKKSTSSFFLKQTKPKIALLSAGANNRYGHPHEEVINRLKTEKTQIYMTNKVGMVRIQLKQNLQIEICGR